MWIKESKNILISFLLITLDFLLKLKLFIISITFSLDLAIETTLS